MSNPFKPAAHDALARVTFMGMKAMCMRGFSRRAAFVG